MEINDKYEISDFLYNYTNYLKYLKQSEAPIVIKRINELYAEFKRDKNKFFENLEENKEDQQLLKSVIQHINMRKQAISGAMVKIMARSSSHLPTSHLKKGLKTKNQNLKNSKKKKIKN